jgi:hypothetical protein
MRVLIVGAGAVGQVFGRHLALGGAEVSFYVKEKYAAECRAGFTMYRLNKGGKARTTPERFDGAGVVSTLEEVAATAWDVVVLTVSSTALRSGWFPEFAARTGDATIVVLQPGPEDRAFVLESVPEARVVTGMISLVSYHAPLPGETRFPEPGMAYWFPPMSPSPFSGPEARVVPFVETLRRGGQPAKRIADVSAAGGFGNATLMPIITALGGSGWKLGALGKLARLRQVTGAIREAHAITSRRVGVSSPLGMRLLLRPLLLKPVVWVAPKLVPFDLETYLRVHFTKVLDQTQFQMERFVESGRREGLSVAALGTISGVASAVSSLPAPR